MDSRSQARRAGLKKADIAAAKKTWAEAEKMLKDPSLSLVLLDELTYMISYGYLDEKKILNAIKKRPKMQHVVITGRGASAARRGQRCPLSSDTCSPTVRTRRRISSSMERSFPFRREWLR